MIVTVEDLKAMPDGELEGLRTNVEAEVSRRAVIDSAEATMRDLNQRVLTAKGLTQGEPWDPDMQHRGGYSKGWTALGADGDLYESLINANVWEPGDPADPQNYRWWKNLSDQPAGEEWDPNDKLYNAATGDAPADEVTFEGSRYRCLQTHRSQPGWTPTAVPALWLAL